MRRTLFVRILVLSLLLAAFTAVSQATELIVWSYRTQMIPESAIRVFEEENPGVTVVQYQPAGAFTQDPFYLAVASGNPPDLIHLNDPFVAVYTLNNLIEPLTPYIEQGLFGDLDVYFPGVIKEYQGEIYYIPHRVSVNSNLYNTELMAQVGLDTSRLPETWDEFREVARRLTSPPDRYGVRLAIQTNNLTSWFWPALWQAGGEFMDEEGRITINTPEALEAMEFFTKAIQEGYGYASFAPAERSRLTTGAIGISMHGSPVNVIEFHENGFDYILPGPALEYRRKADFGSIAGWVIPKGAKADLAAKLLEVSLRPERVEEFLASTNFMPVRRDIGIDYFDPKHRDWALLLLEQVPYMRDQPLHPHILELRQIVAAALVRAIRGEEAPSISLETAQFVAEAHLAGQ